MSCCCPPAQSVNSALPVDFLKDTLTKLENLYAEYLQAETDLVFDRIESYTLDTSQTKTNVKKTDISVLTAARAQVFDRIIAIYRALRINDGTVKVFTRVA